MKHLGNFVALLILAVNALFTGLLLFTAYSPHIQPVTHPVQSCLGLTFPVFLMINAGFLIFWLVIQRYRSALLPLIGMLLCYSQIRTYLPINFHTDHLPETSIKLLSYNIMGFDGAAKQDGKNPILTYLKESGADILCLQEYSTVQSSKHLSQKDVERELKAYPYHRINTVGSGKGHTNKIACYSKFPILSSRILDYPSEYNGSVLYEIKIGEDTVTLINNHLESNKLTKADKVVYEDMLKSPEKEKVKSGARLLIRKLAEASAIRAPQADTIAHEIAASPHPYIIVCGDFNDTPIQPEYKKSIDQLYAEAEKQALDGNPEALVNVKKEFGDNPYELKNILKNWVRNKNQDLKVIPTDSIVIKVDKEAVRRSGMMIPGDSIPDYMHISLKGKRALYKSELMMLEMLSEANWERPIYIAVSVGRENQLNMENHFVQEGLAYRFTPFDTSKTGVTIDSEKMYDNLMNKFKFGGIDKPGIYIDENAMRMCHSHRRIFSQLVQQLMREGKKDKAKAALDYAEKMIPAYNVPYDWQNGAVQMAEAYYQLGETAKADEMMKALADKAVEYLTWYLSLDDNRFMISTREFEYHWAVLDAEVKAMKKYNSKLAEIYEPKVEELYNMYVDRMKE